MQGGRMEGALRFTSYIRWTGGANLHPYLWEYGIGAILLPWGELATLFPTCVVQVVQSDSVVMKGLLHALLYTAEPERGRGDSAPT